MRDVYKQLGAGVRFDWGSSGAAAVATAEGCLVIVDVLSFTTTVSIAVTRGMEIFPYRWRDATAAAFAKDRDADLAVGRSEANNDHPWSLSGAALLEAPFTPRLVLPSPNGATIAASSEGVVVAASLRNASAVAEQLMDRGYGALDKPITVIAAGEKWTTSNALRPALEDFIGAGLVISLLVSAGCHPSVESKLAAGAFESVDDVRAVIYDSASGRELVEDGYAADVDVATAVDVDSVIPQLHNARFVDSLSLPA